MTRIPLDRAKIAEFCKRRGIRKLSLFGSVLRDDFRPDSDVDVLVEFEPESGINFNNRVEMLDELFAIFGRGADLVDKNAIRNPYRRHAIISTAEIVYACER